MLRKGMRHFLDVKDFTSAELRGLLRMAASLKADEKAGGTLKALSGRTLAMMFEKHSTRTRVSFDLAMRQLGGYSMELNQQNMQMSRGETMADTARVLSRYVDAIMMRANSHETLLELAQYATIPVINGLTDKSHPCQVLADILTFEEHKGAIAGRSIAWVGDANNVCTSWVHAAMLLGFHLRIASPKAYQLSAETRAWMEQQQATASGSVTELTDAAEAVQGVDAVVTDTWVSMGDADADARHAALKPYQVNTDLMAKANEGAIFMHCLPAHREEEVTAEVMDGKQSVVWDEAENRLHAQKAVLLFCLNADY